MSQKVKHFLIGAAVFLFSFTITFVLFDGTEKLRRVYEARDIARENEIYLEEKAAQEVEEKRLAEEARLEEEKRLAEEIKESEQVSKLASGQVSKDDIEQQERHSGEGQNPEEGIGVEELVVTEEELEISDQQTAINDQLDENEQGEMIRSEKQSTNNKGLEGEQIPTLEEVVEKFKDVLDLSASEEWNALPLELRKSAYEIMSQQKKEEKIQEEEMEEDDESLSQLDKAFLGVEEETTE